MTEHLPKVQPPKTIHHLGHLVLIYEFWGGHKHSVCDRKCTLKTRWQPAMKMCSAQEKRYHSQQSKTNIVNTSSHPFLEWPSLFSHLFNKYLLNVCHLGARHCSRHLGCISEQKREKRQKSLPSWGLHYSGWRASITDKLNQLSCEGVMVSTREGTGQGGQQRHLQGGVCAPGLVRPPQVTQ